MINIKEKSALPKCHNYQVIITDPYYCNEYVITIRYPVFLSFCSKLRVPHLRAMVCHQILPIIDTELNSN